MLLVADTKSRNFAPKFFYVKIAENFYVTGRRVSKFFRREVCQASVRVVHYRIERLVDAPDGVEAAAWP